jgi:hypothetical protein
MDRYHQTATSNNRRARALLCMAAFAAQGSAMTLMNHEELDQVITKLKATPDAVNSRLRYKLDGGHATVATDAPDVAGKIAETLECAAPRRVFRASKTHEAKHRAHGARPASHVSTLRWL